MIAYASHSLRHDSNERLSFSRTVTSRNKLCKLSHSEIRNHAIIIRSIKFLINSICLIYIYVKKASEFSDLHATFQDLTFARKIISCKMYPCNISYCRLRPAASRGVLPVASRGHRRR